MVVGTGGGGTDITVVVTAAPTSKPVATTSAPAPATTKPATIKPTAAPAVSRSTQPQPTQPQPVQPQPVVSRPVIGKTAQPIDAHLRAPVTTSHLVKPPVQPTLHLAFTGAPVIALLMVAALLLALGALLVTGTRRRKS